MPKVRPIIPITFAVSHNDEPRNVTLDFGDNRDVMSATRWRVPRELEDDESMQARAADAREYALLAAKRWKHYRDTKTAAFSLDQLQQLIAASDEGEFCFYLKVTADWFPASLGGAMVRRTWCNHLMIDFLFVHPSISGKAVNVRNIGTRMLESICLIARALGCRLVWGEATQDSATFYARQLGQQPVRDRFDIEEATIHAFSHRLEDARESD
jgi:hypothetical protein